MMKRNRRMFVLSAAAGIVATAGAVAAIVPGFAEDGARPATTADFQQRATGAQAIALADGVVTPAEYDQAIAAFQACMTAAGLEATVTRGSAPGEGATIGYTAGSTTEEAQRSGTKMYECLNANLNDVQEVWMRQTRGPIEEDSN